MLFQRVCKTFEVDSQTAVCFIYFWASNEDEQYTFKTSELLESCMEMQGLKINIKHACSHFYDFLRL